MSQIEGSQHYFQIIFKHNKGGFENSSIYLMDNSRIKQEFGVQIRPYEERVLQIINEVRNDEGLSEIIA